MKWLGLLALAFYAVHGAVHVREGHAEDALWACHVAAALVGVGLLGGWAALVAVGVIWLMVGEPLWVFDVATGSALQPTSLLTHVGGLIVGLIGLRHLGVPAGVWWKALLALAALQQVCRWVTPPEANVNVAFSVYPWMRPYFASYWRYCAAMLPLFGLLFFLSEVVLRKLLPGG